jgi:UDP-glucose 4-epimerase
MRKLIKKNILITGGAGFIGSVLTQLLKKKYNIYVIDDLSIGNKNQVRVKNFYRFNLNNKKKLNLFFRKRDINFVIHLAAHSNLRKSDNNPKKFYYNNYQATKNIIDCCIKYRISKFIFSSTASVYGSTKKFPILEKYQKSPISIYGKTKLKAENYIISKSKKNYNYVIFRFFNVAGALIQKKLGETKNPPEHFIPIAIKRILNDKNVNIFNKFNTEDGSGVRDYIHVSDVAAAHKKAIIFLTKKKNL